MGPSAPTKREVIVVMASTICMLAIFLGGRRAITTSVINAITTHSQWITDLNVLGASKRITNG